MSKSLRLSAASIVHSYDRSLRCAARLATFCAYRPMGFETDIDSTIDELAVDDILNFAIAFRRLVEITKTESIAKSYSIATIKISVSEGKIDKNKIGSLSLWESVNSIIHCNFIDVIRSYGDAFLHIDGGQSLEQTLNYFRNKRKFTPVVILQTQRASLEFEIISMLNNYDSVSEKIIELCQDNSVYLERIYRDPN